MNTKEKAIINGAWRWIEEFMKVYNIYDPITPNKDLFYKAMENEIHKLNKENEKENFINNDVYADSFNC